MQNIAKDLALTCDFGRDVAYVRYFRKKRGVSPLFRIGRGVNLLFWRKLF